MVGRDRNDSRLPKTMVHGPHAKVSGFLREIAILWLWSTLGFLPPPLSHFFSTLRYVGCCVFSAGRLWHAPYEFLKTGCSSGWVNYQKACGWNQVVIDTDYFFITDKLIDFQTISCSKSHTSWDLSIRGVFWNSHKSKTFHLVSSAEGYGVPTNCHTSWIVTLLHLHILSPLPLKR